MNFKPFKNIFESNPVPKTEEVTLENGVVKTLKENGQRIDFDKEKTIDGLTYYFHLFKGKNAEIWNLTFDTDQGMLITNKGLSVYKQIIDNIVILINTAKENERIEKVAFFGACEDLRTSDIEEFKEFLKVKTEHNKYVFDNFSYIENMGDWKRSLRIQNGQVFIEESGKRRLGLKDKVARNDPNYQSSKSFSIDEFVDDTFQVHDLLNDKEVFSALMQHIGADFSLGRNTDKKDSSKARTDLYERTLKQRFPNYGFERRGNDVIVSLV